MSREREKGGHGAKEIATEVSSFDQAAESPKDPEEKIAPGRRVKFQRGKEMLLQGEDWLDRALNFKNSQRW